MKVLFDPASEYSHGAQVNYNFKDLESEKSDLLYAYGIHPGYRMSRPSGFKNKIYFVTVEIEILIMHLPKKLKCVIDWELNWCIMSAEVNMIPVQVY